MNILDKKILFEIHREATKRRLDIAPDFTEFCLELYKLNPDWDLKCDDEDIINLNNVYRFTDFFIHSFEEYNYNMTTLDLQFYLYRGQYIVKEFYIANKTRLDNQINYLKALTETSETGSGILHKLITYVALASGMGNPRDKPVYNEVRQAILSISSENKLQLIYSLPYIDRERVIDKTLELCAGIRLFNMECGLGGQGIKYLPTTLEVSLGLLRLHMCNDLNWASDRRDTLCNMLQSCYEVNQQGYKVVLQEKIPEGSSAEELRYCQGLLTVYEQFYLTLQQFFQWIDNLDRQYFERKAAYDKAVSNLHLVVRRGVEVKCEVVFPLFEKLNKAWKPFKELLHYLMGIKTIYFKIREPILQMKYETFLVKHFSPVDYEMVDEKLEAQEFDRNIHPNVRIIEQCCSLRPAFRGFCCWRLVLTNGLLILGDDRLGVAEYRNVVFRFSSRLGLHSFARNPDYYIKRVIKLARDTPCLVYLLNIKELVTSERDHKLKFDFVKIQTKTKAVQTELHPILENKDREYHWNIWELRRQALTQAKLTRMRTVAIQNAFSLNDQRTQFDGDMVDNSCQTRVDNYTNTTRPISFIYGLRGRKDDKQFVLDLTPQN